MPTCRYCDGSFSETEMADAHIIPRAFFHDLKGPSKKLLQHRVSESDHSVISNKHSGPSDRTILCDGCERKFSTWDGHGVECLRAAESAPYALRDGIGTAVIPHAKYEPLKLFALSVLWRAAVSSDDFFSSFTIADQHEANIRVMLKTGNPGQPNRYPVIVHRVSDLRDVGIIPPRSHAYRASRVLCRLHFGRMWISVLLQEFDVDPLHAAMRLSDQRLMAMALPARGDLLDKFHTGFVQLLRHHEANPQLKADAKAKRVAAAIARAKQARA